MAFQQPQQRPAPLRQVSFNKQVQEQPVSSPARKRTIEESQEWIVFQPQDDQSRTSQTPRTATQRSDFGSLETHVRSQPFTHTGDDDFGTDGDDDGAELDSLDDGLHAFHHNPFSSSSQNNLDHSGGTVLPTHDGFGTFPSTAGLQEQLWQFERYNPQRKRHVRRRSSVQKRLDALIEDENVDIEDDRTARIEKWRLEQSRAVLDEIEKETRRRRRRMSRMSGGGSVDIRQSVLDDAALSRSTQVKDETIIEESESDPKGEQPPVSESFWQRITRKVIRDLIGLDENTLSVIFGESLPPEASPTPTQPSPIALATASSKQSKVTFADPGYSWEVKLLNHIARELGVLVHQLTEHDGRAFHTYLRIQTEEPEYAGLPMPDPMPRQPSLRQQRRTAAEHARKAPGSDPMFHPTIFQTPVSPSDAPDSSLWGIEEEPADPPAGSDPLHQEERAYWERDVDVNMIFTYLRRRFSQASSTPSPSAPGPLPASWATEPNTASALGTSPESLRRAEVIRRQHPLVSRAAERAQSHRRDSLLRRHHLQQIAQKRAGSSSCASQSTKRSRRTVSGSSRHYWDIGGSVGSVGSGPAMSSGGLGGWGEV